MSRKKWLAHDIRKAQALEHVASSHLASRTAAAWEIVDLMQQRFGQSVSWKTAYMWLPAVGRRHAEKAAGAVVSKRRAPPLLLLPHALNCRNNCTFFQSYQPHPHE